MSNTGEQSVSVEAPSMGTGLGVPGAVTDRIMESFQGLLKGKSIIEAESQEVRDQFAELIEKKKTTKARFTSLVTQTKGELKNVDSNKKTKVHETYIKAMLDSRLDAACQLKAKLDNIYFEIISVIDAVECGPEESSQWAEVQA